LTSILIPDHDLTMSILTKKRMAFLSLAIALLTTAMTTLLVNSVISNRVIHETQERIREALNTARWVYASKTNDIDRVIRLTSVRYVVRDALKRKDPSFVEKDMLNLMAEEQLDFLTLVDRNGTVLVRYHNPGLSGDRISDDPFFKDALRRGGISGTQVLPREALLREGDSLAKKAAFQLVLTPKEKPTEKLEETSGMVLKSAHVIRDGEGRILGVLMGGVLLNRNYEIVDRIKHIVFKDAKYEGKEIGTATIFLGDLRISTNVLDREGHRAVGTRVMEDVGEQVLGKELSWIRRAYVVDDWYITAYEPIRDVQDNIVGILYVGILESKYVAMNEKLILLFMFGMLVSVAISCLISFRLLKNALNK
jgi:two-component system NtrC family sensor kinase